MNPEPSPSSLPRSTEPDAPPSPEAAPAPTSAEDTGAETDYADSEQVGTAPHDAASEPADWKDALRADFERWIAALDAPPEFASDGIEETAAPDLYSFFEELAILSAESRKANRRSAEAISQWSEILDHFQGDLSQLRALLAERPGPESETLPQAHCLALVDLLDRTQRLTEAFGRAPSRSWWWNDRDWRQAWQTQRRALEILRSHLEALLQKEGITRIETVGAPFDPTTMSAVAVEPNPLAPPRSVLQEVLPGYARHGAVLRLAQVKVSSRHSESP